MQVTQVHLIFTINHDNKHSRVELFRKLSAIYPYYIPIEASEKKHTIEKEEQLSNTIDLRKTKKTIGLLTKTEKGSFPK